MRHRYREPQWEQTHPLPSSDGGSLMHARPDLNVDGMLPGHLECLSLHFLTSLLNPRAKSHTLVMALITSSLLKAKKVQGGHLTYWVTDA